MQRRKIHFFVLALIVFMLSIGSGLLLAQTKSTVFSSKHDISAVGGGCKGCHLPHQSSAKGEVLLWARDFPTTASFGIYDSPTMQNTPTDVGGSYSASNLPSGAKMYTVLCLSCHDGITSTSVITVLTPTHSASVGNPTNSDGLSNDHPVNMAYSNASDAGLEPLATVQASDIKLFNDGANETVQCASCHNAHDNTTAQPFLRVAQSNTKAGLCTVCHK